MNTVLMIVLAAATVHQQPANSAAIPCLSGFVRTAGGSPVAGADLDFIIHATGEKLITPGDNTDLNGFYSVCVLPGVYDVTVAPPPGSRLLGKVFRSVDLTADLGKELDVTLEQGIVLSGRVTAASTGLPVATVDIDVDFVGGTRVFTPGDKTDLNGSYRIVVPPGLFRVRFEPLPGSRLRGLELDSVTVAGDKVIDVALQEGFLLTGRIRSDTGSQLTGVSVDLRDFATGRKVFVANNETDVGGDYVVTVPAGTFELRYVPPPEMPYIAVAVPGFQVSSDVQRDQILQRGSRVTFVVRDFSGAFVPGADIDVKQSVTQTKIFTPHDHADAQGRAHAVLLADTYDLRVDPPVGTPLDRVELSGVPVRNDTLIAITLPEVVRRRIAGRVIDAHGAGISGIVVEARLIPSEVPVFIPAPSSDVAGNLDLSIPVGTYDVYLIPPLGSRVVAEKIRNVTVASDSTWSPFVLRDGVVVSIIVTGSNGRPLEGADIDILRGTGAFSVFVPHDETDAEGKTQVGLIPDLYSLVVTPLPGSGHVAKTVGPASISNDTTITIELEGTGAARLPAVSLAPAAPNPFRDQTVLKYDVGLTTDARIDVFDVAGRWVRTLVRQESVAGPFDATWDGTDDRGRRVPSGVYFLRLRTESADVARKVLVVR